MENPNITEPRKRDYTETDLDYLDEMAKVIIGASVANPSFNAASLMLSGNPVKTILQTCEMAYDMAETMLAIRKKKYGR